MSARRLCATAATALAAAGCAQFAMPDHAQEAEPPTLGLAESDRFASAGAAPAVTQADLRWWRRFDDPALGDWVERALAANADIALADERVQQARALLQSARARRGVFVGAQAESALRLHRDAGERRVQPGAALLLEFDTDLWGGLRAGERSAAAGMRRGAHLAQAARLAAAGLTARAYLEWQAALHDHRALDDALALQREALRIVSVRVEAGLGPVLDRDRAQAELAGTEADRAAAGVRIGQSLAALQVLAGDRAGLAAAASPNGSAAGDASARAPAQAAGISGGAGGPQDAAATRSLPALQGPPAATRPVDLLRLRPDLLAAEQALVAAAADIGVAEAELRPRLRLPGSLVFGSALAGGGALELARATLAAVLDVTLFDGGDRRAGVDAARSRAREAALRYRQTLLRALQQVESALVAQRGAEARIAAQRRASAASGAAEAQAQTLYRSGLAGYLDVVDAQRSALTNRRELLQAQADAASAAVIAFEAMGLIAAPDRERPGS